MNLLVTGGGTGGHIYPALSIAKGYRNLYSDTNLLYVGRKEGLESELLPNEDIDYEAISITYMKKKNFTYFCKYITSIFKAVFQSYKIIKKFKPDVIVGTGGYVTGPVIFVGQLLGVKTVLHESNAFVGRANRFLSKKADLIFVAYENLENQFPSNKKIIVSGTPVRKEFKSIRKDESRKRLNLNEEDFLVISFSGSGGAKKINESSIELMNLISGNEKIKYIHVTGKNYFNLFMKKLKEMELNFEKNIEILPYIDDMPLYMNASDLLITRGGAMTLAEIVASKTPSIIIPSPNVKDNHQEHNGKAMEEAGAAIMIKEEELTHSKIYDFIINFSNDRDNLENMRKKCYSLDKNNALDIIIKGIKGVL